MSVLEYITFFWKNRTALSPAPIAWENTVKEVVPSVALKRSISSSNAQWTQGGGAAFGLGGGGESMRVAPGGLPPIEEGKERGWGRDEHGCWWVFTWKLQGIVAHGVRKEWCQSNNQQAQWQRRIDSQHELSKNSEKEISELRRWPYLSSPAEGGAPFPPLSSPFLFPSLCPQLLPDLKTLLSLSPTLLCLHHAWPPPPIKRGLQSDFYIFSN